MKYIIDTENKKLIIIGKVNFNDLKELMTRLKCAKEILNIEIDNYEVEVDNKKSFIKRNKAVDDFEPTILPPNRSSYPNYPNPNITFTSVDFTEKSFEKLPDYSSTGALMTQEEVEELLKKYEK